MAESGNVRSVRDRFTGRSIDYAYDSQHQLISAISSDAGPANPPTYVADFQYTPAGRVLHVHIHSNNPTSDVRPRDVDHIYDDNDAAPMAPVGFGGGARATTRGGGPADRPLLL